MPLNKKNSSLAPAFTWLVLMQLEQHHNTVLDSGAVRIRDLAFNRERHGNDDRQRAAEELVLPMMNLYSAIGRAKFASGMTRARVKRLIVDVLVDGEKTVQDLAAVFDTCYRFSQQGVSG